MNLSPGEVLEKSWKFVSEKGYEPCIYLTISKQGQCFYWLRAIPMSSIESGQQSVSTDYWHMHKCTSIFLTSRQVSFNK